MEARRSWLITSALVVSRPCGKPGRSAASHARGAWPKAEYPLFGRHSSAPRLNAASSRDIREAAQPVGRAGLIACSVRDARRIIYRTPLKGRLSHRNPAETGECRLKHAV